jgi:hypothetical protein
LRSEPRSSSTGPDDMVDKAPAEQSGTKDAGKRFQVLGGCIKCGQAAYLKPCSSQGLDHDWPSCLSCRTVRPRTRSLSPFKAIDACPMSYSRAGQPSYPAISRWTSASTRQGQDGYGAESAALRSNSTRGWPADTPVSRRQLQASARVGRSSLTPSTIGRH